jgi:hypothetical protein
VRTRVVAHVVWHNRLFPVHRVCKNRTQIVRHEPTGFVLGNAIHTGNCLHQPMRSHWLVRIHCMKRRHVKSGQPHIADHDDLKRVLASLNFLPRLSLRGLPRMCCCHSGPSVSAAEREAARNLKRAAKLEAVAKRAKTRLMKRQLEEEARIHRYFHRVWLSMARIELAWPQTPA